MAYPFFTGDRTEPIGLQEQSEIPASRFSEEIAPENYTTDPALANAVNIAILMGKPLLLTGEPGTGKTQFAGRLAWELGNLPLFKFETKSTSKSSDLFYYFNMVGYFQSAQTKKATAGKEFITFNALGEAILNTLPFDSYANWVPDTYQPNPPQRSVVLIDEIDKAPRDFPNDILNELEGLYFKIPELGNPKISVNHDLAPIVVITSNSERNLPETFLRRCIFHHIEFPDDPEVIQAITRKRLGGEGPGEPVFAQMTALFSELREHPTLNKKPALGELLLWMQAVQKLTILQPSLRFSKDLIDSTIGILLKSNDDIKLAEPTIKQWLQRQQI